MAPDPVTRSFASFRPKWQRFHESTAPLRSTSGAGALAGSGSGSAAGGASRQLPHAYARQYSHAYGARLAALRGRCVDRATVAASGEGGSDVRAVDRIIEVKDSVPTILVGTLVKAMDPKRRPPADTSYRAPSAAEFLFPETGGKESLRSVLFDSDGGDVLHLEDESGRVELVSAVMSGGGQRVEGEDALDPDGVATGVVAAVFGEVDADTGVMHVRSIHFAGPPPDDLEDDGAIVLRGPTIRGEEDADRDPHVILVSGLGCGSDTPADAACGGSLSLRREMLADFLTGTGGAAVCRVVIAGGGCARSRVGRNDGVRNWELGGDNEKDNGKGKSANGAGPGDDDPAFPVRELDAFLSELTASGVPIDFLPGLHDPTNANWPQRPIHSCLLPNATSFVDHFHSCPNPYEALVGGVNVLGSDGLSIADLRRFLAICEGDDEQAVGGGDCDDMKVNGDHMLGKEEKKGRVAAKTTPSMNALRQTLFYGHMAPTGPDSLPMFPSSEIDPFVMKRRPGVYFAGNCERFETKLVGRDGKETEDAKGGTRLICVPSFSETAEAVMVNLNTLEVETLSFQDT